MYANVGFHVPWGGMEEGSRSGDELESGRRWLCGGEGEEKRMTRRRTGSGGAWQEGRRRVVGGYENELRRLWRKFRKGWIRKMAWRKLGKGRFGKGEEEGKEEEEKAGNYGGERIESEGSGRTRVHVK